MAKPIIFTLLLGNNDQILEKINTPEAQNLPTVVSLKTNNESHISDKDRIFAEILRESIKQGKDPIFNIQLNNNDIKPIFKSQDLTNLQNLNVKSTITFDHYNSLAENPELANYWQELLAKADHVFFANKEDQELAIKENIVSKDKTTSIKDKDIDLVISVFNNLTDDQKVNKLLSDTIPDKTNLDKIIKSTKSQGGRVIIKTWPLTLDDATNLVTAKFGITADDQIYGLKLEINEILKDPNNAAENLQKYVSQISQQFQKDRGIVGINPIDFNFDREKVMKDKDNATKTLSQPETTKPILQEKKPESRGIINRFFSYLGSMVKNFKEMIFGKNKEETIPPQEVKVVDEPLREPSTQQPQMPSIPTQSLSSAQSRTSDILINTPTAASPISPAAQQVPPVSLNQQVAMTPEQSYKAMTSAANAPYPISNANNAFNINDFKYAVSKGDVKNVKKPDYWYEENHIIQLLTNSLDGEKISIQPAITLNTPVITREILKDFTAKGREKQEILKEIQETKEIAKDIPDEAERNQMLKDIEKREKIVNLSDEEREKLKNDLTKEVEAKQKINEDILNRAVKDIKESGKESAVIPVEMGYGHWCGLFMTYDKKEDQVMITFNDSLGNSINHDGQKLPKLIDKALDDLLNKPITIDEQTKQQNNSSDCGVFTTDNLIKLANGKPILSTKEAKNEGQNLRNQHATILTRAMAKEQAQEIGRQSQNKQFSQVQKLMESRRHSIKNEGRKL
ncbi:MAG: Ulp1 family isopeptidase [Rickettsia endosymbiont of Pentastiridius leporinus]